MNFSICALECVEKNTWRADKFECKLTGQIQCPSSTVVYGNTLFHLVNTWMKENNIVSPKVRICCVPHDKWMGTLGMFDKIIYDGYTLILESHPEPRYHYNYRIQFKLEVFYNF
jgi:hypothetical protein